MIPMKTGWCLWRRGDTYEDGVIPMKTGWCLWRRGDAYENGVIPMKTVHSYLCSLSPLFIPKCFHFLIQFIQFLSNLNMISACVFCLWIRPKCQTCTHRCHLFNKLNPQLLENAGILEFIGFKRGYTRIEPPLCTQEIIRCIIMKFLMSSSIILRRFLIKIAFLVKSCWIHNKKTLPKIYLSP